MSQLQKKFLAPDAVDASKLKLLNDTSLRSRNAADDGDINILRVDGSDQIRIGNGAFNIRIGQTAPLVSVEPDAISINAQNGDAEILAFGGTPRLSSDQEDVDLVSYNGTLAPRLRFWNAAETFYVGIKALAAQAANYTLTLPPNDGNSGDVLQTDGAGVLTWVPAATAENRAKQTFTLNGTDITNQFVTLSNPPLANSVHFIVKGGAPTLEGASHDYTVSGSTIVFQNDLATGGASELIAGDIVQVVYEY